MKTPSRSTRFASRAVVYTLTTIVELESFGPFVRADLRVADSALVRTVVHGPAPGAARHVVTVIHYSGDGLFTEAPPGTYTPWAVLQPGTTGFGTY